jgi:hypothetical protein
MKNKTQSINQIILPYAGIMAVLCLFAQVVIAVRGSEIDFVAGLALVPAYLYYLYFHITSKDKLSKVRFGRLVAHFVAFLIVNLSYHIHAAVLSLNNINDTQGPVVNLSEGWFGVLFGMFVFWGIGLLIHMIASIAQKGYEELDV